MTYHRWLFAIILICATHAQAFEPTVEIVEQFDNSRVVAFVKKNDIENSPEWNPNRDAPPLSVALAVDKVEQFNQSKAIGAIKEIEIRPVPRHPTHWNYLIKVDDDEMRTKYAVYVVLMNGMVIPAIIEPQSYK